MPHAGWPDKVTPKDMAHVLGVSDKTLRHWLRDNRSRGHHPHERWLFTPVQADEIVGVYQARRAGR
jgi:excisionase family DNA binding protein